MARALPVHLYSCFLLSSPHSPWLCVLMSCLQVADLALDYPRAASLQQTCSPHCHRNCSTTLLPTTRICPEVSLGSSCLGCKMNAIAASEEEATGQMLAQGGRVAQSIPYTGTPSWHWMTGSRLHENLICAKQNLQRFQRWTQTRTLWSHASPRNTSEQTCSIIRAEGTRLCSRRLFGYFFSWWRSWWSPAASTVSWKLKDALLCHACAYMWWLGCCNCSCNAGDSSCWAQQWSRARNDKYTPLRSEGQEVPGCPLCRRSGSTKLPWAWGHCTAESSSGSAIQQPQGTKAPGRAIVGHESTHRAVKLPKQLLMKTQAAAAWREKLYVPMDAGGEAQVQKSTANSGEISRLLFGRNRIETRQIRLASPVQRWMVALEEDLTCSDEKPVRAMQWFHGLPPPWMAVDPPLPCYQLGGH